MEQEIKNIIKKAVKDKNITGYYAIGSKDLAEILNFPLYFTNEIIKQRCVERRYSNGVIINSQTYKESPLDDENLLLTRSTFKDFAKYYLRDEGFDFSGQLDTVFRILEQFERVEPLF